jgi:hypothetical protein
MEVNMSKIRFLEKAEFCLSNLAPCTCTNPDCQVSFGHITRYFTECHPFVFSAPDINPMDILEVGPSEEIVDLPFPVISIEILNGFLTVPRRSDDTQIYITLIIAREVAPREYEFLVFADVINGEKVDHKIFEASKSAKGHGDRLSGEAFKFINTILIHNLKKLSRERVGLEARNKSIKIGTGKNKTFFRPKNITYVSPKKYIGNFDVLPNNRNITWSHRWPSRGHWRTISGIGKDRSGDYCVTGHTWVMESIKGPENAPLIKKTYLVKEGETV